MRLYLGHASGPTVDLMLFKEQAKWREGMENKRLAGLCARIGKLGFAAGLAAPLLLAGGARDAAAAADLKEPVRLALINSSDTDVATYIFGQVLVKAGYRVDYIPADYTAAFTGVEQGDLDVALCWETTWDVCRAAIDSGKVRNIGSTGIRIQEGWWYPTYLEKDCPGLPAWRALLEPACQEALQTAETAPKARFVAAPADWITYLDETIEAYGLPFEAIPSGSSGALIATMQGAYERQEPVIGWGYSPHWFFAGAEGRFVEFQPFDPACHSDPTWGEIKDKTHDCATQRGFIWKLMNTEFAKRAPGVERLFHLFMMGNAAMAEGMREIDVEGTSYEDMAARWIEANEAVWRPWIE